MAIDLFMHEKPRLTFVGVRLKRRMTEINPSFFENDEFGNKHSIFYTSSIHHLVFGIFFFME